MVSKVFSSSIFLRYHSGVAEAAPESGSGTLRKPLVMSINILL